MHEFDEQMILNLALSSAPDVAKDKHTVTLQGSSATVEIWKTSHPKINPKRIVQSVVLLVLHEPYRRVVVYTS